MSDMTGYDEQCQADGCAVRGTGEGMIVKEDGFWPLWAYVSHLGGSALSTEQLDALAAAQEGRET